MAIPVEAIESLQGIAGGALVVAGVVLLAVVNIRVLMFFGHAIGGGVPLPGLPSSWRSMLPRR